MTKALDVLPVGGGDTWRRHLLAAYFQPSHPSGWWARWAQKCMQYIGSFNAIALKIQFHCFFSWKCCCQVWFYELIRVKLPNCNPQTLSAGMLVGGRDTATAPSLRIPPAPPLKPTVSEEKCSLESPSLSLKPNYKDWKWLTEFEISYV